jgi:hypothetical protein
MKLKLITFSSKNGLNLNVKVLAISLALLILAGFFLFCSRAQ